MSIPSHTPLMAAAAIACNAAAQLALKHGGMSGMHRWQDWTNLSILAGAALYGVSFILTIKVYAAYPLSMISPLMAGGIFILITLGASWFFAEPVTLQKLSGMLLIVAGIALLGKSA